MRTAFVKTLTELASQDKNVWLMTGDLGFSVFEDFIKHFPNQYLNGGVAEQNLISMAAGAAMAGKKVFVYSISTFATMRPYEQIRNDICYQNLPVFIIGDGSTFSYSTFGCTHMPLEDLAIMRALPNMQVVCPGDPVEVGVLLEQLYLTKQPAYIRLGKNGESKIHVSPKGIVLGKAVKFFKGEGVGIVVTGRLLSVALNAASLLANKKIKATVLHFHTLKPFDEVALTNLVKKVKKLVIIEEHSIINGLGSAVAETLMKSGQSVTTRHLGVPDKFPKGAGSQQYFFNKYKLTEQGILQAVRSMNLK